jgi:RNA polymerase sigma factor (sigma-70 family)
VTKDALAHIEDKELLNRFYTDRNNRWLGILLERYTLLLFGVCMKYLKDEEEAKDAVQQIYLKVITELQKYKVEYFKSWLYMIAKNLCLMKLREKHHRPSLVATEAVAAADDMFSKAGFLEKEKTFTLIEEGMNELNKEQKQCITLFYLQKKSYQEITDFTGFNLQQVKSHIQNGKRNLKLIVEKKLKKVNG